MPRYTMRRTWPDDHDRPNDYVFKVDGKDAGRCYFMRAAGGRDAWLWTVYGSAKGDMEDTLEEAQRRFKETLEGQTTAPGLRGPGMRARGLAGHPSPLS